MTCPICKKDPVHKYRPFCSQRCADIDLGKWMTGAYAIPSQGEENPDMLDGGSDGEADASDPPPGGKLH